MTTFRRPSRLRRLLELAIPALRRRREARLNEEIRRLVCDAPREPVHCDDRARWW